MNSTTDKATADERTERLLAIMAAALGVRAERRTDAVSQLRAIRLEDLPTDTGQAVTELQTRLRDAGVLS